MCQRSQDILAPALEAFVIFDGKNSAECIAFFNVLMHTAAQPNSQWGLPVIHRCEQSLIPTNPEDKSVQVPNEEGNAVREFPVRIYLNGTVIKSHFMLPFCLQNVEMLQFCVGFLCQLWPIE